MSHDPRTTPLVLRVDSTWDGAPADPDEIAELKIGLVGSTRGDLRIEVDAPFHDDPPPTVPGTQTDPAPTGPTRGLWNHEVVELFVASADGSDPASIDYLEVELAPRGHHLVLRLRGIRQVVDDLLPIDFTTQIDAGPRGRWRGEATVPEALLPKATSPNRYRVGAFAIHGSGADRRYLAWTPVPGRRDENGETAPDFHRPFDFPVVDLPVLREPSGDQPA